MKKTILTSFIALAAIVAMPATAQTTDAATGATKTEQTTKQVKKDKVKAKGQRDGAHRQMRKADAFEGITLTDLQKEALKALRPQRPERPEKNDGEKNDTLRQRPDRSKMRADYVNGVKAILTPDQYVVFLENIVVKGANLPGDGHDRHISPMHKGDNRNMHQGAKKHGKSEGKAPRGTKPEKKQ